MGSLGNLKWLQTPKFAILSNSVHLFSVRHSPRSFRNKTLDSRGPKQGSPPWTMETSHSLVSHVFPTFQPATSFTQQPFSYIPSCTDLGAGGKVRKEHLYFKHPIACPLEMQVSCISCHLLPQVADSTKATLVPSHSSHSAAILTLKKKNLTCLQQKFVGLQHNGQDKQSATFKRGSATSISLRNQTKQKARARCGNTAQGKGARWGKALVGHEGKRRASKKAHISSLKESKTPLRVHRRRPLPLSTQWLVSSHPNWTSLSYLGL